MPTLELREDRLGTMIQKLKSEEADEEIRGKQFCELIQGVQTTIAQSKYRNGPPPIILKKVTKQF